MTYEQQVQTWIEDNYISACPAANLLLLAEEGIIDWERLSRALIWYLDPHNDRDRETVLMATSRIAGEQVDKANAEAQLCRPA